MKKIIFNENTFKSFKRCAIMEAVSSNPYLFGTEQKDYKQLLASLSTVPNLRTDKYTNHELEEYYNDWKKTGFDISSNEYQIWCGALKKYLDYLGRSIYFVLNNKVKRIADARPYYVFLDPSWVQTVKLDKPEDFQGIYSLTLKIYQNKVVWNDLFFNPIFEDLKNAIKEIRAYANKQKILNPNLNLLLPKEEYIEIGKYMNSDNAQPELFYGQTEKPNNEPQVNDDEPFDWG